MQPLPRPSFAPIALMIGLAAGLGLATVTALTWPALAQDSTTEEPAKAKDAKPKAGLKTDTTQPIKVEADELSVDQETGIAVFTGNVRIDQGELRATAPKATMYYTEDRSEIERVHLQDGVTLTNGLEVVTGQDAVYTVTDSIVVITGDVIITQGESTIAGPKATYNLDTGAGVMDGGRVQSVFLPGAGDGKGKGKKKPAATDAAGSDTAGSDSSE